MNNRCRICYLSSFLVFVTIFLASCAQTTLDRGLAEQIAKIKAIDNHTHISPAIAGQGTEEEPADLLGQPPFDFPVNIRVDSRLWIDAWQALYGYKYNDMDKEHLRLVFGEKQRIKREQGENYPTWMLDKLGVEIALVNSWKLGLGLEPPRFRHVTYANSLMYPFPSMHYPYSDPNEIEPAATLDEYIKTVVIPELESYKKEGSVAIKFNVAYWRPLNFEKVSSEEAAPVYVKLRRKEEVPVSEHRKLEDFLFRYITQEAGRIDLKVHIHTSVGSQPYYDSSGGNPMLLESVFNDPNQHNTQFVILHGGWPFARETGAMLKKPNVYVDFSAQTFLCSTHALSETIRAWLEWYPEKVLFGSDAYAVLPLSSWEERTWLSLNSTRKALAIALTEMMNDGQISRNRAVELAEMVLRTNAIGLYDLELQ